MYVYMYLKKGSNFDNLYIINIIQEDLENALIKYIYFYKVFILNFIELYINHINNNFLIISC